MASVLNRATKEFRKSVNTPDFNVAEWIINPDLTDVAGSPRRYWKITGDIVTPVDASERITIDAAILADRVVSEKAEAKTQFAVSRRLKALAELLVVEFNNHTQRTNAILLAIASATNLSSLKASIALINDLPVRDFTQLKNAIDSNIDAGVN